MQNFISWANFLSVSPYNDNWCQWWGEAIVREIKIEPNSDRSVLKQDWLKSRDQGARDRICAMLFAIKQVFSFLLPSLLYPPKFPLKFPLPSFPQIIFCYFFSMMGQWGKKWQVSTTNFWTDVRSGSQLSIYRITRNLLLFNTRFNTTLKEKGFYWKTQTLIRILTKSIIYNDILIIVNK